MEPKKKQRKSVKHQILHLFVLDEVNVFVVPVSVIFGVGTVKRNIVVNGVSVTITIVLFTMVLSVEALVMDLVIVANVNVHQAMMERTVVVLQEQIPVLPQMGLCVEVKAEESASVTNVSVCQDQSTRDLHVKIVSIVRWCVINTRIVYSVQHMVLVKRKTVVTGVKLIIILQFRM